MSYKAYVVVPDTRSDALALEWSCKESGGEGFINGAVRFNKKNVLDKGTKAILMTLDRACFYEWIYESFSAWNGIALRLELFDRTDTGDSIDGARSIVRSTFYRGLKNNNDHY